MSYNWDGLMVLFGGKYRPTWISECASQATVNGVMELDGTKYKPIPDAYDGCTAEEAKGSSQVMVLDVATGKYFPRIVKNFQFDCCYGDSCATCTGENSLWAAGQTPNYVFATVSGITECSGQCAASYVDFNSEIPYKMTQHPDFPCYWFHVDGNTVMRWGADTGAPTYSSSFYIWTDDGAGDSDLYFLGNNTLCATVFVGRQEGGCCGGDVLSDPRGEIVAYGGAVAISWT